MAELVAAAEVTLDEVNARGAEVSKLVSSKAFVAALLKALEKPPLLTKDAKIKEANRDIVFKVLENIATDAQIGESRLIFTLHRAATSCLDPRRPSPRTTILRNARSCGISLVVSPRANPDFLNAFRAHILRFMSVPVLVAEAVEAVAASSASSLDLLLKYVYLALATPRPPVPAGTAEGAALEAALLEQKKWSGLLLKWHPVVVAKTGPGGVVRVMTERKTV
jgi:hypothetical protein